MDGDNGGKVQNGSSGFALLLLCLEILFFICYMSVFYSPVPVVISLHVRHVYGIFFIFLFFLIFAHSGRICRPR